MSRQVALYGFVRRKDGLHTRPLGVDNSKCTLLYAGEDTAAVVSLIKSKKFQPNPQDLIRHEEVVNKIFDEQVILPAKFPKILTLNALERSMNEMSDELKKVLRRIVYKGEYQIRAIMNDPTRDRASTYEFNDFSKYVMKNCSRYKYKHYFPVLTKEGKEAEFIDYAETVIKHVTQELCKHTTYWRGKTFQSEKLLLESFFWVRKHNKSLFLESVEALRKSYPNLKFNISGPNPPYNFVELEFAEKL